MIVFNVSRLTIHRAVTAMLLSDCYMQPKFAPAEQCDDLGIRLILMNADAMTARYGDPVTAKEHIDYKHETKDRDPFVLYQACCCLRYQCCEGKVPETNILYKQLEDTISRIAHHIVRESDGAKTDAFKSAWQ